MKLIVKEARIEDRGRGIVRIDPNLQIKENLKNGDILEISHNISNKKTAALLYKGLEKDKGTNIIRLDTSLLRNLRAFLDDFVEIRRVKSIPANRIVFAGYQESVILKNSKNLSRKLENRAVTKGDVLSFYAYGRRVDLVILDIKPNSDTVKIHLKTKIIMIDEIKQTNDRIKIYQNFLKINPDYILGWEILGDENIKIGKYEEAIQYYKRIDSEKPIDALEKIAYANYMKKDYDNAELLYNQLLKCGEKKHEYLKWIGHINLIKDSIKLALRYYKESLENYFNEYFKSEIE